MLLRVSWDLAKTGLGSKNLTPWNMASKLGLLSLKLSTTAVSSSKVVDVAAQEGEFRVFIVAGEVSGDSIASRLMVSLKKLSPLPVRFAGVGGFLMSKEGLQTLFPMEEISVMGLWELLPHLNTIRKKLKETTEAALLFRPHVVISVDSKGFSFRLLKQLKAKYLLEDTCPVHVHYVAPSFWAWKGGEARLQNLCEFVDHMLCIIPFEEEICRLNGLAATYVGHPLLEDALMLNLASTAALCASGSAVIELQLARLPCIVAYQTHILTELVIHYRTKLKYISLPNILMNTSIIPEVLFRDCTPGNLATILSELIHDKNIQEQQTSTAEKFLGLLCPPSKNVNMLREDLSSGIIWCPSMIAASTILSIQKQKRD